MRRFTRFVLITLVVIASFVTIVLLAVNLYVQSQRTQTRIQQEISQRLGTRVGIRHISVTPWGGIKLGGITIPQTEGARSGNFLEAKVFRLRLRFWSLLSQRVVIKEVSLVDPHVIWPQDRDGKWRLPEFVESEIEEDRAETERPPESASPAQTPTQSPAVESPIANRGEPSHFVPEVRRIRVKGGNFRFFDASEKFVASFEGLDLRSGVRDGSLSNGNANVAKISLRDRFFLRRMRSLVRYTPEELKLSEISAVAGGGQVTARFDMKPQMEGSPFSVAFHFQNVSAEQVIAEAGGDKDVLKGRLEGTFEGTGRVADSNALDGTGVVVLRDGQVRQYSLLVALGQVLQIEELTQLHLEQAEAKYRISSGLITVDDLILRSPNTRLSARGTITLDGKMKLDSRLAINEKVRNQLFKQIRNNFRPLDEPGQFAVDFEVGGTVDRPKSNIVEKLVGKDLKEFGSVINSFLGGGRQKKPDARTPSATATPAGSP